jgi:hypothetical protein
LEATYQKSSLNEQNKEKNEEQYIAFKTPNYKVFETNNIAHQIETACQKMLQEEANFEGNSSGWSLLSIDGLLIRISRHVPLRGSSYMKLPAKIAARMGGKFARIQTTGRIFVSHKSVILRVVRHISPSQQPLSPQ